MGKLRSGKKDEIKKLILDWLKSGKYKPGERIPSEPDLVVRLGCSRSTIREAIGLLVNEGYLSRLGGSGTYVTHNKQAFSILGLLVPSLRWKTIAESTVAQLLAAIELAARERGVRVIVYSSEERSMPDDMVAKHEVMRAIERENLQDVIRRRLDGMVIFPISLDKNADMIMAVRDAGIPVVCVDRFLDELDMDYVETDNYGGAHDAVTTMAQMGIRNIYCISLTESTSSVQERIMGYSNAVNALGLACNIVMTAIPSPSPIDKSCSEYSCLKNTLSGIRLPAALFSINAVVNSYVLAVLKDLNIPLDQVVLGYFDSEKPDALQETCYFEVDQPFEEIGNAVVQIISDKLSGQTQRRQVSLRPDITIHNLSSFKAKTEAITSENPENQWTLETSHL